MTEAKFEATETNRVPRNCSACGAPLESPLACQVCHALQDPFDEPTPHEVFGLAPALRIDERQLERKLMKLSRSLHPDFFATAAPEIRELAERNSARLNDAYRLLTDSVAHTDWWIEHLGGPSEKDERQMPTEFLMEVLEWNETIDEADGAEDRAAQLAPLGAELASQRSRVLNQLADEFGSLPEPPADLVAARKKLNAVRYLDRALARIEHDAPFD